ncbi:cell division protein FtsZ [Candidatus Nanohalococcus occultus]|uniref:Cell division protein FtsZ n=1 Tax=Candidatus Nanohalococcus occultus TaxID=2978047 RepID=A0ABY8CHG8_9ARCH|nr:Cell division GTPase [Candidatus Nanohaloarchaeota archaeon SVXNc]
MEDQLKQARDRGSSNVPEAQKNHDIDDELEELIRERKAEIKVIGSGGAGNNTISRLVEVGIEGCETIAMNTDAQDLLYANADKKVLIGKELTGGLGAGADPKVGEESAKESQQKVKQSVSGADMVFITCGLGGGTGTGSAPVIAQTAKKEGALTVGIVTLPFEMEGQSRQENAEYGLERLEDVVDTLIVIPNDKLLEIVPDVSLNTAFKIADEILVNAVKGVTELVTKPGLVNLDFADIRAVMGEGGIAMIGMGQSDTDSRAQEAVSKALSNPLLDVEISGGKGALVNVTGGTSLSLKEAQQVVNTVSDRLSDNAKVIWGAQIRDDMDETLQSMIIVTGVNSPQIYGQEKTHKDEYEEEIEQELGVEFI